ncbi:MAG: AAA family ATPase [Gemmatimonadetes bacterium]|nr:AAA family ATPase [Gemmatimonadota bacterium]
MRFESVHIDRYGCLADLSTGREPLPSIVVVLGPNESGKSTFFSFLTTLLFGFHPANRAGHPYTPWSGGSPEGRGRIRLDGGGVQGVHRRLTSAASGQMTTDEGGRNIANRRLPAVEHVTRTVFRQVYALTLAELAGIEGESWAIVQDRLVGAMGVKDVRPARTVADEFETEANRLWRPDNRGRPRVRVLRSELADLNERRRHALELDRMLRAKAGERAEAERTLDARREEADRERERRELLEDRLNRLQPVRRALARIEELRRAAGAEEGPGGLPGDFGERPEALRELPGDPVGRLEALRDRRREAGVRIEQLDREAALGTESVQDYRDRYEKVAAIEEDVRTAAAGMTAMPNMKRGVEEAEAEVRALEARCLEQGASLFTVPWGEVSRDDYAGIDAAELREQVAAAQKSRERLLAHQAGTGGGTGQAPEMAKPGWASMAAGLVLLAGGLGLVGWWFFYPSIVFETLGGTRITAAFALSASIFVGGGGLVALGVRAARAMRYRRYRMAVEEAEGRRAERVALLKGKEEDARETVRAMVSALPLQESLLETLGLELPTGIEKLAELAERLQERNGELARRREKVGQAAEQIAGVRDAVSFHSGGETPVAARVLNSLLDAALKAREGARAAEQQLEKIEAGREDAEAERAAATRELHDLEARLAGFADGDPDRGAAAAAERLQSWRRAGELREELERTHPQMDGLVAEIAAAEADGESWEALREGLDELDGLRERRTSRAEELQATIARLETEIAHLEDGETADTIEGRIEVLKEQVREAKEGRDRAFLLARLVREADRRFREENQPELLKRAGRYLGEVTHGRYDRIELGDPGDESFYLREPAGSTTRKVGEALSQGTKEQVYLALRLAIISHLDADRERLPLFMDETLVNWDAWRRDRAFGILERVAEERQVFIFTCHPAMAAEMEDRGARVIPLAVEY